MKNYENIRLLKTPLYITNNKVYSYIIKYLALSVILFMYFFQPCLVTGADFASDYERIAAINRQISHDSSNIDIYAESVQVRNGFFHLIYGSGDDFSAKTVMYYSRLIAENSIKYKIDPMLVLSVIATESSFNKAVVSPVGAIGLMQLMPSTAKYISKKTGISEISYRSQLFNPAINIAIGSAYLAYLIKLTGSVNHALIAYNIGPSNLFHDIRIGRPLPKSYVYRVMEKYNKIKSLDIIKLSNF